MNLLITGVSGYLGGLVLEALAGEPSAERIVGVDVKPPRGATRKLEFHRLDVRDPRIMELMAGCDAVLHMAFVLDEIRDKELTYDININGSRNVFDSCLGAGVPWIIHLSSMAVYGPHPDNPVPLTESDFPRGAPDCYYCYSKAQIEHYLRWLGRANPELDITVLRPTVILGEKIDNTVSWMFARRFAASIKGRDPLAQFIHEQDLVEAVMLVLRERALGTYNITSDDYIRLSEMMERAGMIAPAVPKKLLCRLADISFRVGTSPVSSHWIRMFSESMVGTSERLKELGWRPTYTSSGLFDEYLAGRRKELKQRR